MGFFTLRNIKFRLMRRKQKLQFEIVGLPDLWDLSLLRGQESGPSTTSLELGFQTEGSLQKKLSFNGNGRVQGLDLGRAGHRLGSKNAQE